MNSIYIVYYRRYSTDPATKFVKHSEASARAKVRSLLYGNGPAAHAYYREYRAAEPTPEPAQGSQES